jgi:hypothetical protein
MNRVVVQWIGHSDLRAMAASLPAAQRDEIMQPVRSPGLAAARPRIELVTEARLIAAREQYRPVGLQ